MCDMEKVSSFGKPAQEAKPKAHIASETVTQTGTGEESTVRNDTKVVEKIGAGDGI